MNKILTMITIVTLIFSIPAATVTDVYDLTLNVKTPMVINNTQSLGYRKYKTNKITGKLYITYDVNEEYMRPVISVSNLVNQTHKVGGRKVTYVRSIVNDDEIMTRLVLLGNNKTGKFATPSVCFYVEAEPSYAIGDPDQDNSLYILLSGTGSTKLFNSRNSARYIYKLNGYLTGTLGCGCTAYEHISPTRLAGAYGATDIVEDVACVHGTWTAKYNKQLSRRSYK